jgi:Tfp pilus assembly protein PilP
VLLVVKSEEKIGCNESNREFTLGKKVTLNYGKVTSVTNQLMQVAYLARAGGSKGWDLRVVRAKSRFHGGMMNLLFPLDCVRPLSH